MTTTSTEAALSAAAAADRVLDALAQGQSIAIVACLRAEAVVARMAVYDDGRTFGSLRERALDEAAHAIGEQRLRDGGNAALISDTIAGKAVEWYVETHRPAPMLLIVGAGHIALPLAKGGAALGFRVTVLDDREDFVSAERFPEAADVRRVDFTDPFRDMAWRGETYVLLVTRAHKYDFDCLRALLNLERPPPYIGMIGSRRRVRAAFGALLDSGVPRERLAAVRAPVGLDIGAETPQEIAVSILAELIAVRRGGDTSQSLAERERVLDRLMPQKET